MINPSLQPKWSLSNGIIEKDSITYDNESGKPGGQRVIAIADGVEVSVPHLPYENWLDPSGHVCPLVVSTNRDPRKRDEKYRYVTTTVRIRKGWVPWDVVPVGMTQDQWHVAREEKRTDRLNKAKAGQAIYGRVGKSEVEKLARISRKSAKKFDRLIGELARGRMPDDLVAAPAEEAAPPAEQPEPRSRKRKVDDVP
jgi:hypothetical protein